MREEFVVRLRRVLIGGRSGTGDGSPMVGDWFVVDMKTGSEI